MLSLSARHMTVRSIQGHLEGVYGTEASPSDPRHGMIIDDAKASFAGFLLERVAVVQFIYILVHAFCFALQKIFHGTRKFGVS